MHTVTAIITTYNRPVEIINRALESIEKQTFPVLEILVVDDNHFSEGRPGVLSDLSISIRELCKNRAVYIKQPKGNAGANAARNLGLDNAKGDLVAFLDDDDEWLPQKIERELELMDEDTGLVFCGGIMSENGVRLPYFTLKCFNPSPGYLDMLRRDCIGSTSNPLIRKSVLEECGRFDEDMPARQDYDMWMRVSKKYRMTGTPETLFVHYNHGEGQITGSKIRSFIGYSRLFEKNRDAYRKDIQAWLTIKYFIYQNQPGRRGKINYFLVRAARKIWKYVER